MKLSADTKQYVDELFAELDAFEDAHPDTLDEIDFPEFPHGEFPF